MLRSVRPAVPSTFREDPPLYGRHPDLSDEAFEEFLDYLRAFEAAPLTTLSRILIRDGIELPAPETFTEDSVHRKLWEVIRALAHHRHFLNSTNHLSDLELYRYLWEETLNQPTEEITPAMGECACHIDLVSDGSDESIWLWLRYYADEIDRRQWAESFPGDPVPEPLDPPHDRDRHMPRWNPRP